MTMRQVLLSGVAAVAFLAGEAGVSPGSNAQQQTVAIDADDIGGVVTGPNGPEAGVWVIAETTDLPTRYTKSVVTDDQGRYVIPDLPTANYQVFVRGYGLVDSPRLRAKPGQVLNHTAIPAPNERAAAHYYPAIYWFTMLKIPPAKDFGGATDIPKNITQEIWRQRMNNVDCVGCHQLGNEATRTIPAQFGNFETGEEAWMRRLAAGQSGEMMTNRIAGQLGGVPYKYFGDWTDRIAKGELPRNKPQRPQGEERNLVVTTWDWSLPNKYLHDLISSDRRKPTINSYGKLYGSPEYSTDMMPILDPKTHTVTYFKMPVADEKMPVSLGPGHAGAVAPTTASAYWGEEVLWDTRANNHNSMFDDKGRLWLAATVRGMNNPDFCKQGSDHPSAKVFPLTQSPRQVAMLDPKTMKYSFIDTCFGTHHPQFGYDADNTLWLSGSGQVAGWVNTRIWDETGDAQKAQGWFPYILDTNGNGKLDEWTEPGKPEAGKDMRFNPGSGGYAVMPHPIDGSIWYASGVFGGRAGFLRFDPKTKLSEFYALPKEAIGLRGGDIGKDGVLYGSGSAGHLIAFDRRKCKEPLNGPNATGDHCPEGFTLHRYPGPGFEGFEQYSAEASYYTWVDHHNAVGLGENVPISTANLQDGFVALKDGKMILMRVPYPMGYYAKGLDARIDDPNAGWKGRGLWSASGDRTPWMNELGKGARPLAVHIQVRPDPLAK
ncbi:carboxypeptidase-like regulatory domain-containing protein [Pseudorhodoplanes sp.]|uniref:carboxypeptidase-like regulatory domain-containing protein n=1 Tax=Pseudorhodoplanes sp. TaxID=1934341 RepID=UPI002BFB2A62|nr:carboxypeptidase-like regulatory domain-containing protein [Pseudorhodoplanes sp.]HWV52199.1 carboxypeptidase-like regulatory domain-containing protein [Pseudorhodoplanes sp.]